MGFFDSFKKKEIELPPPPLPPLSNNINDQINNSNSILSQIDNKDNKNIDITTLNNKLNNNLNNNLIQNNYSDNKISSVGLNSLEEKNLNLVGINKDIDKINLNAKNIENNVAIKNNNNNFSSKRDMDIESLVLNETNQINSIIVEDNKEHKYNKENSLIIPDTLPSLPEKIFNIPEKKLPELKINNEENNLIKENAEDLEVFKNISQTDAKIEFDIPVFSDANEEEILKNFDNKINLNVFDFEEPNSDILYNVSNTKKFDKKPLFIRTDHYSSILATIDSVKEYTINSPTIIYNLENLKKNQDIEHKKFKNCIEDIQRKIIYVDNLLFKQEVY
ncbi:MAG: hypothetical protein QW757_00060 [Candidatus Woesearchaeota archaeon]